MRARALIVVAMLAGGVLGVSTVAVASQKTSARIYEAFKSNGDPAIHVTKTANGSCFSGSIAADRNDAWRCISKNILLDPCFSSTKATGIVLCPFRPWERSGVKLKLTKPLPKKFGNTKKPSTSGLPWGIETTSSLRCLILTGMEPTLPPKHFGGWVCANGKYLWDKPKRTTEPWTMYLASAHPTKLTKKVNVKIAWF